MSPVIHRHGAPRRLGLGTQMSKKSGGAFGERQLPRIVERFEGHDGLIACGGVVLAVADPQPPLVDPPRGVPLDVEVDLDVR